MCGVFITALKLSHRHPVNAANFFPNGDRLSGVPLYL